MKFQVELELGPKTRSLLATHLAYEGTRTVRQLVRELDEIEPIVEPDEIPQPEEFIDVTLDVGYDVWTDPENDLPAAWKGRVHLPYTVRFRSELLRMYLARENIHSDEFGHGIGVVGGTVSQWCKGTNNPSIINLLKLSKAISISPKNLVVNENGKELIE